MRTSGLDIYTHPTAAPIFFACYGFFSGGLAWHQGAPLFCGPGLGQKKLKSFSRRLRVTSKIGSPYFVWTSGLNIYMQWISPRSKHPPWGQEFQHRSPLLHSCQGSWGEIQQHSSLVLLSTTDSWQGEVYPISPFLCSFNCDTSCSDKACPRRTPFSKILSA